MTLLQLKIAVMAAELGSISLAAKQVGISQSNASTYISDIEEELGIQILNRKRNGITPTEQGVIFLEHARTILQEQEAINSLGKRKKTVSLRVASMNSSLATKAFTSVCTRWLSKDSMDFQYYNASLEKGMEMLKMRRIDIFVAFIRNDQEERFNLLLSLNGCRKEVLGKVPYTIRLRKDHPVLADASAGDHISLSTLSKYPYVDYRSNDDDNNALILQHELGLTSSNTIVIDNPQSRNEIISKTDAFSVGMKLSDHMKDRYNIICLPVQDLSAELVTIVRKNEIPNSILEEFVEEVKAESIRYFN